MSKSLGKHSRLLIKKEKTLKDWENIIEHVVSDFWRIFEVCYLPEMRNVKLYDPGDSGSITFLSFEPDQIQFEGNNLSMKSQGLFANIADNYSSVDFHQIGTMKTWGYMKNEKSKWVIIESKYTKIDPRYNFRGREPHSVTVSSVSLMDLFNIIEPPLIGAQLIYESLHRFIAEHYQNVLQKLEVLQPLKNQSDFEWQLLR